MYQGATLQDVIQVLIKYEKRIRDLEKTVDILTERKTSKKPLKDSSSPTQRLIGYFSQKYKEEMQIAYIPKFAADGRQLKEILKTYDEAKIKDLIDLYFIRRKDPAFIWGKATPTILNFIKRINETLDI